MAASALCTTPVTLVKRSLILKSPGDGLKSQKQAMALADAKPGVVFILKDGSWVELEGPAETALLSAKQIKLRGSKNAMVGQSPMSSHTLRCSDETWERFLLIGRTKWFRRAVDAEYEKQNPKRK